MSQAGRMREVMYTFISVFLQLERWICQYWSVYGSSCNELTELWEQYGLWESIVMF